MPRGFLMAVGCWAVLVVGLTQVWYHVNERPNAGMFYWSANLPTNHATYLEIELSETIRKTLRHDLGSTGRWKPADGTEWTGFFFRWNPGPVRSVIAARLHRPEVCLPASGLRLVEETGLAHFSAHGLQLPFRRYTYQSEGRTLHVFFCQWEDGAEKQTGMLSSKGADRVATAFSGRKRMGQQTFEVILSGYASLAEAEQALRRELPGLIRLDQAASPVAATAAETLNP